MFLGGVIELGHGHVLKLDGEVIVIVHVGVACGHGILGLALDSEIEYLIMWSEFCDVSVDFYDICHSIT